MLNLEIGFDRPWYLLLLLLLPVLWLLSFRSLAGLGNWRRLMAIALRSLVVLLFVLALAEIQLLRISEKLTVIYLLDQSQSIPLEKRQAMMRYVRDEVHKHRNDARQDRAGVIVFGAEAHIEVPPFDDDIYTTGQIESYLDLRTDATNLAAALKLAQASFPEDSARRIVLVTDGNENRGDVRSVAQTLSRNGIGIDVVPVELTTRAEIAVEKITLPSDIRRGQPIEMRVVIHNYSQLTADNEEGKVPGLLKITRQVGKRKELLIAAPIVLEPGKNVLPFQHTIEHAGAYTYKAEFTPTDGADDLMTQNNAATAFSHVRGKGSVLLIEDWQHQGEFDFLVERLTANNIEVEVQSSDELFTSLAELQAYDSVILANVPRSSGDDAKTISNFSDEQIRMLVRNTEQMGCGLIMLGGRNSFGAGGWANTELEKAMPVDFQIKNTKIQAVGALVLMMHASEMAQGNHWQKITAREAIKTLGPMDYCGLVYWGRGSDVWLWGKPPGLARVGGNQKTMVARLSRMIPGDMPQFDPAMQMALVGFNRVNASVKHMIIISDGDPSPPSNATIRKYAKAGIKISTVAVGTHGPAGSTPLQKIATATGGKYYVVTNPKALPRIYQREARRVSRPLIFEPDGGVQVQVSAWHEMLEGIDRQSFRRLRAYMLTTKKQNALVEQSLIADRPAEQANSTILASWTYGLGRSVVFTSDAGHRWADTWTDWESYDKFFSQMVRWSMRPVTEEGKYTVATDYKDGKVRLVITALDKDDEFLNNLNMSGFAVGPDLDSFDVAIVQVAPGRYIGEYETTEAGSYLLNINPGQGRETLKAGISVPYSAEFRIRETNRLLLRDLASLEPTGGKPGRVIQGNISAAEIDNLLKTDTFHHNLLKAISSQDVWPWVMLIASVLFFSDVLVRRVVMGFEWLSPLFAWFLTKRKAEPVADDRMARLQSQKAAISQQIDQRRAATRFEPQVDSQPDSAASQEELAQWSQETDPAKTMAGPQKPKPSEPTLDSDEEESYTARLLAAKKKAWKDKKK